MFETVCVFWPEASTSLSLCDVKQGRQEERAGGSIQLSPSQSPTDMKQQTHTWLGRRWETLFSHTMLCLIRVVMWTKAQSYLPQQTSEHSSSDRKPLSKAMVGPSFRHTHTHRFNSKTQLHTESLNSQTWTGLEVYITPEYVDTLILNHKWYLFYTVKTMHLFALSFSLSSTLFITAKRAAKKAFQHR